MNKAHQIVPHWRLQTIDSAARSLPIKRRTCFTGLLHRLSDRWVRALSGIAHLLEGLKETVICIVVHFFDFLFQETLLAYRRQQ